MSQLVTTSDAAPAFHRRLTVARETTVERKEGVRDSSQHCSETWALPFGRHRLEADFTQYRQEPGHEVPQRCRRPFSICSVNAPDKTANSHEAPVSVVYANLHQRQETQLGSQIEQDLNHQQLSGLDSAWTVSLGYKLELVFSLCVCVQYVHKYVCNVAMCMCVCIHVCEMWYVHSHACVMCMRCGICTHVYT